MKKGLEGSLKETSSKYKEHTEKNKNHYEKENIDEEIFTSIKELDESLKKFQIYKDKGDTSLLLSVLNKKIENVRNLLLNDNFYDDNEGFFGLYASHILVGIDSDKKYDNTKTLKKILKKEFENDGILVNKDDKVSFDEGSFLKLKKEKQVKYINMLILIKEDLPDDVKKQIEEIQKEILKEIEDISESVDSEQFEKGLFEISKECSGKNKNFLDSLLDIYKGLSMTEKTMIGASIVLIIAQPYLAPIITASLGTVSATLLTASIRFVSLIEKYPKFTALIFGMTPKSNTSGLKNIVPEKNISHFNWGVISKKASTIFGAGINYIFGNK